MSVRVALGHAALQGNSVKSLKTEYHTHKIFISCPFHYEQCLNNVFIAQNGSGPFAATQD